MVDIDLFQQYFTCEDNCAMFLTLDKLKRPFIDGLSFIVSQDHVSQFIKGVEEASKESGTIKRKLAHFNFLDLMALVRPHR